jgi:lysyl-tRNA synthetase class 2
MQTHWQPNCSIELLRYRAALLARIRQFFNERDVLEVETPLLSHSIGTDPQLDFFSTLYHTQPQQQPLFLQTSPEFAMKRLLAAGSGSIYQICKAFRNGEAGRFHNPEFTLLEWYRVGFDLEQLMNEVDLLITTLFNNALKPSQRYDYASLFKRHTGLDALTFSYTDYCDYALANNISEAITICQSNHAVWLDFIFSHKVQPLLGDSSLCLVYGYPACHSSLARLNADNPLITDRVEIFIDGVECGNGFYELCDPIEQQRRFEQESLIREQTRLAKVSPDTRLIAALQAGLPDCSGIAIGLDRLLMRLSQSTQIEDVLSFAIHRA